VITVIIPILNEEEALKKNLIFLRSLLNSAEVIFVDAHSTDKSVAVIRGLGKLLQSQKGRPAQMNLGALSARGDILFFLHADSLINPNTLKNIEKNIVGSNAVGGCLTQRIDRADFIYRMIEMQGNIRARLTKEFYGDQGIFVKKDVFSAVGGYPEVPIMEDVLFSRSLRKKGKLIVLTDRISVSARRWEKEGVIRTSLIYSLIIIMFWMRFPLKTIKSLYDDLR